MQITEQIRIVLHLYCFDCEEILTHHEAAGAVIFGGYGLACPGCRGNKFAVMKIEAVPSVALAAVLAGVRDTDADPVVAECADGPLHLSDLQDNGE